MSDKKYATPTRAGVKEIVSTPEAVIGGSIRPSSISQATTHRSNSERAPDIVVNDHTSTTRKNSLIRKPEEIPRAPTMNSAIKEPQTYQPLPKLKRKSKSFDFRDNMIKKSQFIPKMDCILDHYKLGKVIGKGGFSSVYQASHKELGEQRAVKVIKKIANSNIDYRKELNILMELDHPSIVKIYEVFESQDFVYLVQE